MEVKTISELVEQEALFVSNGYATVKVTKDGEAIAHKFPIKSTGVAEYQEQLRGNAPKPPVVEQLIKAESEIGQGLGLVKDAVYRVFDTADKRYLEQQEVYMSDFAWRVVVFALDIRWTKADRTEAKTFEEKREILKQAGINEHQRDAIYRAVHDLTVFSEKETDFLLKN